MKIAYIRSTKRRQQKKIGQALSEELVCVTQEYYMLEDFLHVFLIVVIPKCFSGSDDQTAAQDGISYRLLYTASHLKDKSDDVLQ